MRKLIPLISTIGLLGLFSIFLCGVGSAQDAGKTEKPGSANVETCLKRATTRARDYAARRKTEFTRITVTPTNSKEYAAFLITCEFKDGQVTLFQGGCEAETDQWIIIDRDQGLLVSEAVNRGR